MKKVALVFNHFQVQDGVARSAIGIANSLSKANYEVTLIPLFKFDKSMLNMLESNVIIKPVFGFYFRGFSQVVKRIPLCILNALAFREDYDIEIGFCMTIPIRMVANRRGHAVRFAWMHGYDEGLILKDCYKAVDKLICVSHYNLNRFITETNGEIPADYVYNLIDDDTIVKKGNADVDIERDSNVTFVSVGRHSFEKGYLRLLDCLKELKMQGYNFKFWLIGDGPQHEELIAKANKLGLNEVVFLGPQSNPHAYTSKADVFVCSSYSEGYSTACTEALILNVPIITTDVPGGKEMIDQAECGMLVGISDSELYHGLKSILDNPNIVDEWKQVLSHTKNRFSYKQREKRLLDIIMAEEGNGHD